jgi:hypothetical protein
LLRAAFANHLAMIPWRFAITSPPSGCEEDLHLQAVEHARHTNQGLQLRLEAFIIGIDIPCKNRYYYNIGIS